MILANLFQKQNKKKNEAKETVLEHNSFLFFFFVKL